MKAALLCEFYLNVVCKYASKYGGRRNQAIMPAAIFYLASLLTHLALIANAVCSRGVSGLIFAFAASTCHPHALSLLAGTCTAAVVGWVLKHTFNAARPAASTKARHGHESLGMPSSHANALAFICVHIHQSIAMSVAAAHGSHVIVGNESDETTTTDSASRASTNTVSITTPCFPSWLPILAVLYSLLVLYARVYVTHDHTLAQVLVGLITGSTLARGWLHVMFVS